MIVRIIWRFATLRNAAGARLVWSSIERCSQSGTLADQRSVQRDSSRQEREPERRGQRIVQQYYARELCLI
jgi:hypothetical protein